MIKASEAYFRSANGKEVKELELKIEEAINKAIDQGKFICFPSIPSKTSTEVRNRIKSDLEQLGYKITMADSRGSNAPAEQRDWWDTVTIDWQAKVI